MTAALEEGEWSAARPGPHFNSGKGPVTILQEAGWAPGPIWKGGKSRSPRDCIYSLLFHYNHVDTKASQCYVSTYIACLG